MSSKRYTEEFKIEAVRQVTERGYSVAEVAAPEEGAQARHRGARHPKKSAVYFANQPD